MVGTFVSTIILSLHSNQSVGVFYMSSPVSRVLLKTTIYLDQKLLSGSSRLLRTTGPVICSPTALLRIEFTASSCLHEMGELLPRLSTLTASAQAGAAVYLCCTCPRVTPGGRYPLSLPYGARTFLTRTPLGVRPRLSDPVAVLL